jgi:hypothetical protein
MDPRPLDLGCWSLIDPQITEPKLTLCLRLHEAVCHLGDGYTIYDAAHHASLGGAYFLLLVTFEAGLSGEDPVAALQAFADAVATILPDGPRYVHGADTASGWILGLGNPPLRG